MRAASAGTHPFAVWQEIVVSAGERYQFVYGSMRELARREPTFGLHVHVAVPDPEDAIHVANRLRTHIPLLLALSVNSPFWQGRDTGLASARTPLFQAFPRVGIPRDFADYADYAESVDVLIRSGAVPEPTFLWWDVRPQPRFGTVEVRIMDAQTKLGDTAAIAALVQCIVRAEVEAGTHLERWMPQEVLSENRFLAARDGMDAELIEPELERRVPARELLADLVAVCRPHAQDLGCEAELDRVPELGAQTGAQRQIDLARSLESLPRVVGVLANDFLARLPSPRRAAARTGMTIRFAARRGSLPSRRRSIRTSITTVLLPTWRGSALASISSPRIPAAKTFSFSSIVVKLWPGGMQRKVDQAATVSPSAVQTPPWTKPPGCRWRSIDDDPAAGVGVLDLERLDPEVAREAAGEEGPDGLRGDHRAGVRRVAHRRGSLSLGSRPKPSSPWSP